MLGSRIFLKLFFGFTLVIVVSSFLVWTIAAGRVESRTLEEIRHILVVRARMLGETGVLFSPGAGAEAQQGLFESLAEAAETRFTLIRADGLVLADSWQQPAKMDNHKDRPEVAEAHRTRAPAYSTRYSKTTKRDMMYVAVPVLADGRIEGIVRAAVPLSLVENRLRMVRENIAIAAGTAALVALCLGLLLTRYLLRPLKDISEVAEAIAGGDLERRPRCTSHDEIGQVADAVRKMASQLTERLDSLIHERNQLRAILGSMLEGVVALDRDEHIVHINETAAAILRTPVSGCVGKRIWEVARIEELSETIADVLRDDAEQTREVRLSKALRERIIELHAAPLRGSRGAVAGVVLVLHDVTELRRLELVRREFVANISHELKTPLTAVRGFAETLLDRADVDDETRLRFVTRIRDQAVRLSVLVNDLLVLSRVESEKGALEMRPLDLRQPIAEASRRLDPEVVGRRIRFRTEVPDRPVVVLGDEEGLRQVVDNLLDNAFKYTSDEGEVSLRLLVEGTDAVIEIRDTGIGIEPDHIDRIFERFYRVDKARSRELGGTGLGLSIVKHIVEAHEGAVSVESKPGVGSAFFVRLKLREAFADPDD